jgi:molybdopterin-guanine dinucleotide biosynthesis protein A
VVVGPEQPLPDGVLRRQEDPPGGGPVAGLAAGLAGIDVDWVAVLAADLPFLDADAVGALRRAAGTGPDGALLVDPDGRAQYLAGVYRTAALRAALAAAGDPSGQALRRLVAGLSLAEVRLDAAPPPWFDCDEPDDVRRAERWMGG